jgi:iron(III) transport system substrate-binding protein
MNQMRGINWGIVVFFLWSAAATAVGAAASTPPVAEVVVYSARGEALIKPMFDAYTAETGVPVRFISNDAGALLARLTAEKENTPADLLITVDVGNLWYAASQGLFQPVDSPTLKANIPAHLKDAENRWFGLSLRVRTVVYRTDKVKPSELSTYEALGDPKWKGRLCLRTSKKVYNQSMVAMMIATLGTEKAEKVVGSWVKNLAAPVFSDDTQVMEAIAAGQCDVGIVNSYYFGRLMEKKPNQPLALFWPNQNDRGVHVNVSGAGVTRHAKQPKAAIRLLEWLASDTAQKLFASVDFEYPVNPKVPPSPAVAAWGVFRQEQINVSRAGELQTEAIKLMDRAGYK